MARGRSQSAEKIYTVTPNATSGLCDDLKQPFTGQLNVYSARQRLLTFNDLHNFTRNKKGMRQVLRNEGYRKQLIPSPSHIFLCLLFEYLPLYDHKPKIWKLCLCSFIGNETGTFRMEHKRASSAQVTCANPVKLHSVKNALSAKVRKGLRRNLCGLRNCQTC